MTSGGGKLLAAALVLLAALGGGNYVRNWLAEADLPRPYRGYSDAELETLLEAYRVEVETLEGRLEAVQQREVEPRGGSLIGERVEDFERARRHGERLRGLARDAAERESMVEALEREQAIREYLAGGWRLHWERLVSLQPSPQPSSSSSKPRSSPR